MGDPLIELETGEINLEVNAERGGVIAASRQEEDVKIGDAGTLDRSQPLRP